jgi:cobyrinic acid a,c-diamide synthase
MDFDAIWEVACSAPGLPGGLIGPDRAVPATGAAPRIGVLRDSAFTFYYPENIEALARHGGRIVEISGLRDETLPPIDALYIGGGFPETHARQLAENESFRASVCQAAERGLPIYAECGGLLFLGESVEFRGSSYPMAGVFPVTFTIEEKPQGHGYMVVEVDRPNAFFPQGTVLRGHEFHYARVADYETAGVTTVFSVRRGAGFDCGRDGLAYKNVLASFCHVHALGEKQWATALVQSAERWMKEVDVPSTERTGLPFETRMA